MRKLFFFLIALIPLTLVAAGIPRLTGPVVDIAGVFSSSEYEALSSAIRDYYKRTDVQFQVLTLKTLEGDSIDDFSIRLAEKWKIGGKKGTGVIIVAAIEDRNVRIEVGQGLEGEITDVLSSRIIRQLMAPYFRKNRYGEGFAAAIATMSKKLGKEISFSDRNMNTSSEYRSRRRGGFSFFWIILLFFLLRGLMYGRGGGFLTALFLGSLLGGGRGGFGSSGFGGGWSGGGGGFSGGGASGSW